MLYLTGNVTIVILESANLDEIRKGRPAVTPDGKVLVAWTPDPLWLAEQIRSSGGDARLIARAIDEGAKRPQTPLRDYHEPVEENLRPGAKEGG